ncbi:MAG: endonuclease/exonuclease/phosphatase family protein [Bacteroidales bacterium]|nr:endonuclease/exonuclease/phosphatase family protein [Bacteroidales bacterium]
MKKRKINILLLFCILNTVCCLAQQPDFLFMSYNVENLFDTIDNPRKNDNEFLPSAERKWNSYRYHKKLRDIAKVIVAAGQDWHNPDVIGLCEVENDTCLKDLIHKTILSNFHYNYIHYDSEDARGIDVALLYNEQTFKPIFHQPLPVVFDDTCRKTRDILYVTGIMTRTNDTIHIFECHFPSRRGGKTESEPYRMAAARVVRNKIDSIYLNCFSPYILVSGDFNDAPTDKSILEGLRVLGIHAATHPFTCQCLYGLEDKNAEGTHKFQGEWEFLDQAMVSYPFFFEYAIQYHVLQNEFLLKKSEKTGESSPYRTYLGPYYKGGISDHLPILVSFKKRDRTQPENQQ